ncbi:MAG: tripartite tricarboxylate transporter TctB family protein [Stackebrandtia sp.]
MTSPTSRPRRGRAPLGPRIFGGGALLAGLAVLYVAYRDLKDGKGAELLLVNSAIAPLLIAGLWVLFAGIFFVRQLVNPFRDYPGPGQSPVAEAADDEPESIAKAESDDKEPDADEEATIDDVDSDPTDVRWLAPVLVVAALVVYVFALEPIGFIFATSLFFIAIAAIFGSRSWIRDSIVGILLSVGIYYLFTQALYLVLPSGELLPWTF